jgi:tetratricopeptide (TPR) repeat protein
MTHLKEEDMARMISGNAGKKERKKFLEHLSRCESCNKVFTETLRFFEEEEQGEEVLRLPGYATKEESRFRRVFDAMFKRPILVPALAVVIIILLIVPFLLTSSNNTRWWINEYGDYTKTVGKNDSRVKRAFAVFERVKNVADKVEARIPRLFIINTNGSGRPFALVLPDGGIIINLETLEICCGHKKTGQGEDEKKLKEGDQWLAFILGHEIAHLAQKDFTHQKAFLGQQKHEDKKMWSEDKKRELLADTNGALYAVMAGYDISALFGRENKFLRCWVEQAGIGSYYDDDPQHPAMQKRVEFIRTQLQSVINKVELFRAGVLFLQMGKYTDGAAAFRKFSGFYPAREVFNNIGVCYLNLALRYLRLKFSDDYFRFRLSTVIDYHTSAEKLSFRGEGDYLKDRDISNCIDQAIFYFREAAYRDRHDRTCRLNLSAALILKKDYAAALAQCDFLLDKNPGDIEALNNKAIALYYYDKEIYRRAPLKAVSLLEKTHRLRSNNFEVLYNLAALAWEMKQPDKAKFLWEKYLNLANIPRDNYYTHICKELGRKDLPPPTQPVRLPVVPKEIKLGEESALLLEKWDGENVSKYKLTGEEEGQDSWWVTLQVIVKQNLRVLAWEGFIVLVEQELIRPKDPVKQLKRFGPPQKIIHHTAGTFYIYEKKGFSLKEIDGMICSYIWFKQQE